MSEPKSPAAPSQKLDRESLEAVARVFSAFSDATRLAILQELKEGRRSVGELVELIGVSQGQTSKQLQLLSDAGLLRREKEGTQAFYSIRDEMVFSLCKLVCEKLNRDGQARSEITFHI